MVTCSDDTIYTGYTANLSQRIKQHNAGKGARYTRSRRPVKLSYVEIFSSQRKALRRERALKKISRKEKLALIKEFRTQMFDKSEDSSAIIRDISSLLF
ncbi:MAG: GIY-YIG nuclease family protein [Candidatus Heimdallarchaeota archaeon]|nr:GIY-YIG nuclease family protein [Candidatus Heimdallarchaeota archaeon]